MEAKGTLKIEILPDGRARLTFTQVEVFEGLSTSCATLCTTGCPEVVESFRVLGEGVEEAAQQMATNLREARHEAIERTHERSEGLEGLARREAGGYRRGGSGGL